MPVEKDNHIDPELKARWGFGGTEGNITVGPETVGETGGVDHARSRIEPGGAHNNGGGDEAARQALELDAVNLLAEQMEAGFLDVPKGEGVALRVHKAVTALWVDMESLAKARDEAVDKAALLQKQVDDLLAQAEKDRLGAAADPLDDLTAAQIKEQLDARGVTYKVNDSKPELLALLKANQ